VVGSLWKVGVCVVGYLGKVSMCVVGYLWKVCGYDYCAHILIRHHYVVRLVSAVCYQGLNGR
jgi:hypothetical protein